jgi:hypothetical protein
MPAVLKLGDATVRGSWAIDLMVDSEWRMRGVAPVLSEAQATSSDLALALNVSEPAYRAYLRAGWIDLGTVPLFVRPLHVDEALDAADVSGKLVRGLGRAADTPLRVLDGGVAAVLGSARMRLAPIERFDERADILWRSVSSAFPAVVRRDLRWLRWRFDDAPDADTYRRFYLFRSSRLVGYLVARSERRRGQLFSLVCDYLVRPAFTGVLFALAIREARTQDAVAVACRTLNVRGEPWLRALGFARPREKGAVPVRFLALPRGHAVGIATLADRRSWLLTSADSDLDHDRD